jgi:hypothetical protein
LPHTLKKGQLANAPLTFMNINQNQKGGNVNKKENTEKGKAALEALEQSKDVEKNDAALTQDATATSAGHNTHRLVRLRM